MDSSFFVQCRISREPTDRGFVGLGDLSLILGFSLADWELKIKSI